MLPPRLITPEAFRLAVATQGVVLKVQTNPTPSSPSPAPPPSDASVLTEVYDSHCHLPTGLSSPHDFNAIPVKKMCVLATCEDDWEAVRDLHLSNPERYVVGFGIHPWFVHKRTEGWLERLRELLVQHPTAVVGEIGLDKARTQEAGIVEQLQVFREQWALAAALSRPVSVHCVRAFGEVQEAVKKHRPLPPSIVFHSWGGNAECSRAVLKAARDRGVYFGLSRHINMRGSHKWKEVVRAVPFDRILLESDRDHPDDIAGDLIDGLLHIHAEGVGYDTPANLAAVLASNAERALAVP